MKEEIEQWIGRCYSHRQKNNRPPIARARRCQFRGKQAIDRGCFGITWGLFLKNLRFCVDEKTQINIQMESRFKVFLTM